MAAAPPVRSEFVYRLFNDREDSKKQELKKAEATYPVYKLILMGADGTGKNKLAQNFVQKTLSTTALDLLKGTSPFPATLVSHERKIKVTVDIFKKPTNLNGNKEVKVDDAHGILLVCDVTKADSFEYLKQNIDAIPQKRSLQKVIVLMATHCDCESAKRKVSQEELIQFANKHKVYLIETDGKREKHVQEAFDGILLNFSINPEKFLKGFANILVTALTGFGALVAATQTRNANYAKAACVVASIALIKLGYDLGQIKL